MTDNDFTTVSYDEVYHVGTLDDGGRDAPHFSNEGKELSVTRHPDAWRQIASTVYGDTYVLTHPGNPTFYKAVPGGPPRDIEFETAENNNYITYTNGHKAVWKERNFSESGDEDTFITKTSFAETKDKLKSHMPAGVPEKEFTEQKVPILDTKGREYWFKSFASSPDIASPMEVRLLLPIWFAIEKDLMGIWKHNEFAPHDYSAPLGAIRQERLDEWDQETL